MLRAPFSRLAARLGRPGSILARLNTPDVDFGGRNAWIFEPLRPSRVFEVNVVRPLRNTAWAHEFPASGFHAAKQKCRKFVPQAGLTVLDVPNALR